MNSTVRTTLAWLSTTPRGLPVLPDVYWMKATSSAVGGGEGRQAVVDLEVARLEHVPDVGGGRLRFLHSLAEPPDGGDRLGLRVAEDVRGGLDPEGGIERYRDRAQAQRAEERVEELGAGGVDQAHLVAAVDAGAAQAGGVASALPPEAPVRHRFVEEVEVRGVGVAGGSAPHQFGQGGRDGRSWLHAGILSQSAAIGPMTSGRCRAGARPFGPGRGPRPAPIGGAASGRG